MRWGGFDAGAWACACAGSTAAAVALAAKAMKPRREGWQAHPKSPCLQLVAMILPHSGSLTLCIMRGVSIEGACHDCKAQISHLPMNCIHWAGYPQR